MVLSLGALNIHSPSQGPNESSEDDVSGKVTCLRVPAGTNCKVLRYFFKRIKGAIDLSS